MKPKEHLYWPKFEEWAKNSGVATRYQGAIQAWWDCWINGFETACKEMEGAQLDMEKEPTDLEDISADLEQ